MSRFVTILLGCALAMASQAQAGSTNTNENEQAAASRDKVICKRFAKTGSLVATYKTCKTKWEWDRERENLRQSSSSTACQPGSSTPC